MSRSSPDAETRSIMRQLAELTPDQMPDMPPADAVAAVEPAAPAAPGGVELRVGGGGGSGPVDLDELVEYIKAKLVFD